MNNHITPNFYIKNFLNNLRPETPIYKYISVDYIADMKRSGQLRFCLVNKWEDVYENYFLKQNFITQEGIPVDANQVANRIYGQCWTLREESDAMWRIYSQDKRTIRVKTTAEKLMDVLYVNDSCMADTYIGKVDYLPQGDIEQRYIELSQNNTPISSMNNINNFILESLITKREEFVHEEEVRILKVLSSDLPADEYIDMAFVPDTFFDEFTIDPRVTMEEEDDIRTFLIDAEIDPEKIRKSCLYDLNRYTLVI